MPAYSNAVPPSTIYPGDAVQVLTAADPTTVGFRSQRVAIGRRMSESLTPFVVDLDFNQAPGAYELDVTVSNSSDVPADYILAPNGAMTTTDASGAGNPKAEFVANAQIACWVSLFWKTAPANGGTTVTATIRR